MLSACLLSRLKQRPGRTSSRWARRPRTVLGGGVTAVVVGGSSVAAVIVVAGGVAAAVGLPSLWVVCWRDAAATRMPTGTTTNAAVATTRAATTTPAPASAPWDVRI